MCNGLLGLAASIDIVDEGMRLFWGTEVPAQVHTATQEAKHKRDGRIVGEIRKWVEVGCRRGVMVTARIKLY